MAVQSTLLPEARAYWAELDNENIPVSIRSA